MRQLVERRAEPLDEVDLARPLVRPPDLAIGLAVGRLVDRVGLPGERHGHRAVEAFRERVEFDRMRHRRKAGVGQEAGHQGLDAPHVLDVAAQVGRPVEIGQEEMGGCVEAPALEEIAVGACEPLALPIAHELAPPVEFGVFRAPGAKLLRTVQFGKQQIAGDGLHHGSASIADRFRRVAPDAAECRFLQCPKRR